MSVWRRIADRLVPCSASTIPPDFYVHGWVKGAYRVISSGSLLLVIEENA